MTIRTTESVTVQRATMCFRRPRNREDLVGLVRHLDVGPIRDIGLLDAAVAARGLRRSEPTPTRQSNARPLRCCTRSSATMR